MLVGAGFVQFIESVAVAEILAVEGSIVSYFRKLAPNDNTASGIAPELMDNYIKSCGLSCFHLSLLLLVISLLILFYFFSLSRMCMHVVLL